MLNDSLKHIVWLNTVTVVCGINFTLLTVFFILVNHCEMGLENILESTAIVLEKS